MTDAWQPAQYDLFKAERAKPFHDLVALVAPPPPGCRVADLGCGTGELTATLLERFDVAELVGIDSSGAMLAQAAQRAGDRFEVVEADIGALGDVGTFDVIVANASLQWLADHRSVMADWAGRLRPGGQLAVQVPANPDHPSHTTSIAVAHEATFFGALGGEVPPDPLDHVLDPARYAEILDDLGFVNQHVRLQVYGFHLPAAADVVEWVKGTSLTRFAARLDDATYAAFVNRYRERLVEVLGDQRPYFYAFKRILLWGRWSAAY